MEQKEIVFNKRRNVGEIVSDTFEFIKQNKTDIIRVVGIYVLPFLILLAGTQVYFQKNVLSRLDLTNQDQATLMANLIPFYKNLFLFSLFGIFVQSLFAGTYYTYLSAYIRQGKGNFDISDISADFFKNSLLAFVANLVYVIIVSFGFILCILPSIFFANTFSLIVFINIFKKKGISYSLGKSWKLVNANWGFTFLINILGYLIAIAPGIVFSLMVSPVLGNSSDLSNIANYPTWYWVCAGIFSTITSALMIIPFTFQTFQFFNLGGGLEEKQDAIEE